MRFARVTAVLAIPLSGIAGLLTLPLLAAASGHGAAATSASAIPPQALSAYQAADGWCPGLRWQVLAGIGWVESRHGTSGGATIDPSSGEVTPWIFGPPLDGSPGVLALPIGDWLGWWGLSGPWEQAPGPMQFRAPTFAEWAVDADGAGHANPHNIDDAVATAANYLCGGRDGRITDERAALLRYNRSNDYVATVLAYADSVDIDPHGGEVVGILCPVAGHTAFTDTWHAPRPGGRLHKGVDMFATLGTPAIAPVAGVLEHYHDRLGGLSYRLWGDDGNFYYGTHLAAFGPVTGRVRAATVVGYVGNTGNARGTAPHLHFEIHPGRRPGEPPAAIDPTPSVSIACSSTRVSPGVAKGG